MTRGFQEVPARMAYRTSQIGPITVEKGLANFLRDKRLAKRSPATVDTYERNVTAFIDWFGRTRTVDEIDRDVIKDYSEFLTTKNISDQTYAHYLRELKVYVRYLEAEEYIERAPKVVLPTLRWKIKTHLVTEADYEKLIATISGKGVWDLRNMSLLSLLYDSGARIGEVLGLDTDDVNLEAGEALVTGKGDKQRVIFFSDRTAKYMVQYRRRLEQAYDAESFFVNRDGDRMTYNAATCMLDRSKRESGVTCDVNPHNFRHTFATRFLRNGGDVVKLKRILGHSTLMVTEQYVSLVTDDIKEAAEEYGRKPRKKQTSRRFR